ncbi:FHA domain-containing protein [Thermopirellula anaerolimosa]
MLVRLKVIRGKANRDVVDLSIPAVIGRSREADLTVIHPMISRRHCELFKRDGRIMVRDLGSLNGTYLGASPIKESELRAGDTLAIGPLTFEVDFVSGFKGDPLQGRAEPPGDPQSDLVVADSDPRGFSAPSPATDRAGAPGDKLGTEPQPFASPESSAPTVPAKSEPQSAEPIADTDKVDAGPQGLFGDLPPPESFAPPLTQTEQSAESDAAEEPASPQDERPKHSPPRSEAWADSPAPFTPIMRTSPVKPLPEPSDAEDETNRPSRVRGGEDFSLHLPDRVIPAEKLPDAPASNVAPISDDPSPGARPTARTSGGWWPFGKR